MATKQPCGAINSLQTDNRSPVRGEARINRNGGLRRHLRHSHQAIALIGLGLLLITLVTSLWVRSHTLRLAHLRGPMARTSTLALSGIERSFAALRGWLLLGEPAFKVARTQAWNEVIWPAIAELEGLSRDWTNSDNNRRLMKVKRILEALHGVQWWIEDVAQTPGNRPAHEIADRVLQPSGDTVFAALTSMIDLELQQELPDQLIQPINDGGLSASTGIAELEMEPEQDVDRQMLVGLMVDFRGAFARARTALNDLMNHNREAGTATYHTAFVVAKARLAELERLDYLLYQPQREQLVRVRHGIRAYEVFAGQALALARLGQWNVASDRLASEAVPLSRSARHLLQAMSTNQTELMGQDANLVMMVSNISLGISLALIATMLAVAGVLARRSTDQILQPLTLLLRATQQLAAGTLTADIPVHGRDELAHLTASFNRMAARLERARAQNAKNQFIRETFGRYVSDEVASRVLDNPTGLHLGGETRQVTMLMADLRGFTSHSERLAPEQALTFLNHYLETMVDIIMTYDGTIDEIRGDGIFVFFGAPIRRKDDAHRAVACAVAMQLAIDGVNAYNRRAELPEVEMGIAIHTGEVVVGNIGSQKRTKYAAVGSHVNLTGRIESYTIGGQILISDSTRAEAAPLLRLNGHIQIEPKGVQEPITVYEVRGIGGPYNLFLPEPTETFVSLDIAIALRYTVLEEKFVGRTVFQGQLVKLSTKGGQIHAASPPPPLSNLKIWLAEGNGADMPGELYGKVVENPTKSTRVFTVRFTSVSPAVATYLQELPIYKS